MHASVPAGVVRRGGANMPREPRVHAESGFYHVILRGNGKQLLFENDDDRLHFLKLLCGKTQSGGVSVLAWCLMSNHIHLLLSDPQDNLSCVMHGLATAYSRYLNSASGHIGAVFQGRSTSVPIKSDRQLLQALRYIHDNPEKAGVAPAGGVPLEQLWGIPRRGAAGRRWRGPRPYRWKEPISDVLQ